MLHERHDSNARAFDETRNTSRKTGILGRSSAVRIRGSFFMSARSVKMAARRRGDSNSANEIYSAFRSTSIR
jgi:hypothetical protein